MGPASVAKAAKLLKDIERGSEASGKTINILERWYKRIFTHDRIKYGVFYLEDERGLTWEIKVRWRKDRNQYIKIERCPGGSDEFRAAVGRKHLEKPHKYKKLFLEEWKVLALYASAQKDLKSYTSDDELRIICEEILNDLIYRR